MGITRANKEIQLDRYSALSEKGAGIEFIDTTNTMQGWKTVLSENGAWVRFNKVDLNNDKLKALILRVKANSKGKLELRLNNADGPVLAKINTPKLQEWSNIAVDIEKYETGVHDLFLVSKSKSPIEIDWVKFE